MSNPISTAAAFMPLRASASTGHAAFWIASPLHRCHAPRRPSTGVHALAVGLALALAAGAAAAQQADTLDAEPSAVALDAISVTAERRTENVKDVPISISTVSGETLDAITSSGGDIRILSGRAPSLNIESSFGRAFPRFYIRGLGNTDFDLNASQPVSLVYDDIVLENPLLKGYPMFDLEQVEVLRGPQGTLFGRNTPAGLIKFDSVKPSQTLGGYGRVSYGSYGTLNLEGAIGGPINQDWSFRASALNQRRNDWVDNTFTGENDALEGYTENAVRLQALYAPSETFDALFNVHSRSLRGTARLFRANIIAPGSNDLVPGFERDAIAIDGVNAQDLDGHGGSVRLRWDTGAVTLHSITGYETLDSFSRGDVDGGFGAAFAPPSGPGFIPFPAESGDGLPEHEQITQELRVESNEWGRLDWQAGLYYFHEDITIDSVNYDTFAGSVVNGYARQHQRNRAWAAFGSADYALTDAFKLRAGLRYTQDDKDFVAERLQSPIGAPPTGDIPVTTDADDVSWDLSGTYALDDDSNVYGRVARGFRAPSIQGRLLFGDTVSVAESETVLSYELGYKADLFEDRARLGLSVFRYSVDDQQLTAVGGAANFNQLINARESVGQGVELDFAAYLTDTLLVTVGASYNDTEIRDPGLAVAPCGGGCTVLDPAGPVAGTVLIDGNSLPQAPRRVFNLTARYGIPTADGGEFFVYTDWAYRSEVNFFLYESIEFVGDPLLEGGLRLGYAWDTGRYEVALFGRNILDEEEVVGAIDFNNLTGFVNEPRTLGLEFKASF